MADSTVYADTDGVVMRVVEELSAAADVDPLALDPPLGCVVDPDALGRLVDEGAVSRLSFEYDDYTVVVDADGEVTVSDRPLATAD